MQKYNIYKISSPNTKNIYIGSTKHDLITRLNQHKTASKYNKNWVSSKIIIDAGSPEISLIENIECETKRDLFLREGDHIKNNGLLCINKNVAGRTFGPDFKEYKRAYFKKYYIENKEKHILRCMAYYKANREKKLLYFKNYYKQNKRKI